MKKIENIIDNCKDCKFSERYIHKDTNRKPARICTRVNPNRLAGFDGPKHDLPIPDWCPLETYKEAEKSEAQPDVPTAVPSTIILPGMPSLEWMTENLSGHGGTEINGNWYYTWEQAMAAAAELGDGWRLPTVEEFKQFCAAGSAWVDSGPDGQPGRWFGGNYDTDHEGSLFLPAAGYRNYSSGALEYVGSRGYFWSSSPYSETYRSAGGLLFGSGRVVPVLYDYRAIGFPVRCVREISER